MFLGPLFHLSYLAPVLDLGLGDVLDGHLQPVPVPDARVHDAEAALAQNVSNLESRKYCQFMNWS